MSKLDELRNKTLKWFFWFWIKYYRISFLFIFLILVTWISSLINIPKESSPSINFWIISISTIYPWTNPDDIDSLVTDKIYKEIKNIEWIDKIESSSSLWLSSIVVTLKTWVDSKTVVNEIRNNVSRVSLPDDAKEPIVTDVDTDTNQIFSIFIYWKNKNTSKDLLIEKSNEVKNSLENLASIDRVEYAQWNIRWLFWSSWNDWNKYDIDIVVSPDKLKSSWLTIDSISSSIKAWNKDIPIWNFYVWDKKYDFRIKWKYSDAISMLDIPLKLSNWAYIKLWTIAEIKRTYKDKNINIVWTKNSNWLPYLSLVVNKDDWHSIFSSSKDAKKLIENIFSKESFKNYDYVYWDDMADMIMDDYKDLAKEALTTLVLVFSTMFLFIGFKDSVFATMALPLAFFSTFAILYNFWYSLNFLTNFSLILSFWIAIDTIIVLVQASGSKIRVWYDPETAIILALKEYSVPLIAWVMTTIVAFVPMIFLPWLMWKFISYVPVTIFWVLASWLILALSINNALYLKFVKKSKTYIHDDTSIEYASEDEKELLRLEREWKKEIPYNSSNTRVRIIHSVTKWYKKVLSRFLTNTFLRRISIIIPIIFFVFSFFYISPYVWFELFLSADKDYLTANIEWEKWLKTEKMYEKVESLSQIMKKYEEISYYTISVNNNNVDITIRLDKIAKRDKLWQRSVFEIESLLSKDLLIFEKEWLKVSTNVTKMWPPWWKAVWLKLSAEKTDQLPILIDTAKIFEKKLKSIQGTKSVWISSKDTPWQFIFTLKKDILWNYNIPPAVVYGQIMQMINWVKVWSIEDNWTDMDIYVKQSNFIDQVIIDDILNSNFNYLWKTYLIWNFVEYNVENSIESIWRENWKIIVLVDADLEKWYGAVDVQSEFVKYAETFEFPNWISYYKWWENEENKDLLVSLVISYFTALMVIFMILTFQFNSFTQPIIILYSVIMSLPFIMIWLILTNNPFSITFAVWFISFTWIAVNHWIILIDAINLNLRKWMDSFKALVEAWTSRLEPMTLTTLTTTLWILPIALKDKFWAWLGFTIIFWLFSASFFTLFIVKWIYYEIYLRKNKK